MLRVMLIDLFLIAHICLLGALADELFSIHVVWRHGERAPIERVAHDPNDPSAWPNGYGNLTELGKAQQFCLGKRIRAYCDRLKLFPSAPPDPTEVYVRTTNRIRTNESAIENFHGFFGEAKTHPPVDVHVPFVFKCARQDKLPTNTPEYRDLSAVEKPLLEHLSNMLEGKISLENVTRLIDTLRIEELTNKSLPPWKDEGEELNMVHGQLWRWYFGLDLQPLGEVVDWQMELTRLYEGDVLWTVVNDMRAKIDCQPGHRSSNISLPELTCEQLLKIKYFAISAHDSTISALLSALRLNTTTYDPEPLLENTPNLNAALLFEQWKNGSSNTSTEQDFYVKLNYWYGSYDTGNCTIETGTDQVKELKDYTLPSFIDITEPYSVDKRGMETICGQNTSSVEAIFGDRAKPTVSTSQIGRVMAVEESKASEFD